MKPKGFKLIRVEAHSSVGNNDSIFSTEEDTNDKSFVASTLL